MKKAFITLAAALPLTIAAQFFSSPNQQLIKDAVDGGIIVVEQSYQLEDTVSGQRFGRFGNKEFGKSYTLAVLTDSGYCLAPAALRPWDSDPNFEKYSKTHKPVLYKTAWRHFNDSVFSELDADLAAAVALNDGYAFVKSAGNQPSPKTTPQAAKTAGPSGLSAKTASLHRPRPSRSAISPCAAKSRLSTRLRHTSSRSPSPTRNSGAASTSCPSENRSAT